MLLGARSTFVAGKKVTWGTSYTCSISSTYNKTGIYSAERCSSSDPIYVDWGDGNIQSINGDISQLSHQYSSSGTYEVNISDNIKTFCPSAEDSTWYETTSQNRYTFKAVTLLDDKILELSPYAFYYCSAMTDVIIPSTATSIPTYCFYYCSSLQGSSLILPQSLTTIGNFAFINCSNITAISIPTSVKTIGLGAFTSCSALEYIVIPEGVTKIENGTFMQCSNLHEVILPSSITSIGSVAFISCVNLSRITCKATSAPTVMSNTFGSTNNVYTGRTHYSDGTNALWVPQNATGYNASYWSSTLCNNSKCGFKLKHIGVDKNTPTLSVTPKNISVNAGDTSAISLTTNSTGTVTYSSSNSSIASVSSSGIITGVSGGNCTITVTVSATSTYESRSETCSVEVVAEGGGGGGECLLAGTLITLADGTQKAIENIRENDLLSVWDFDKGEKSTAYPVWVKIPQFKDYYWENVFASGKTIYTTGIQAGHRFFDMDACEFRYNTECVGHRCMMEDGTTDVLVSATKINSRCEYYNVATFGHINCYANGILTSTGLNNLYVVNTSTMKYVKPEGTRINYTIDDFPGMTERWFNGFRFAEQDKPLEFLRRDFGWRFELSRENRRQIQKWGKIKGGKTEARALALYNRWRDVIYVIVSEKQPPYPEGMLPIVLTNVKPTIPEGMMLAHQYIFDNTRILKTYHLVTGEDDPWLNDF